ncbi:MAG TPA: diiron oxygenase [Polyangiaceae bacterium]|nr:diiron oxygenase [Polyangiaceae bacterium]
MRRQVILPVVDAAIDALDEASRNTVGLLWSVRAQNELKTSSVFASLYRELMAFGAPLAVLEMCAQAVSDEVRHAILCADVAARYGGPRAPLQAVAPAEAPSFSVCSAQVSRALFAALHSAINETLATSYLAACLEQARTETVSTALRHIIEDEVRHARIGWAVLASDKLSDADRRVISNTLPSLMEICVSAWLAETAYDVEHAIVPGQGSLCQTELHTLVEDALGNVVIPGLSHVRLDPAPTQAWFARWPRT